MKDGSYSEYTSLATTEFRAQTSDQRNLLVDATNHLTVESVLDVGCGGGHQLLPFAERTGAYCVGVDIAEEVVYRGPETFRDWGLPPGRAIFLRSRGDEMPFRDGILDVVICRVALPYMDTCKSDS